VKETCSSTEPTESRWLVEIGGNHTISISLLS
jgi:hypothetical protein